MGQPIYRTKEDGTTVREWLAQPVLDQDGNIIWEDERAGIPVMDTDPEVVLE